MTTPPPPHTPATPHSPPPLPQPPAAAQPPAPHQSAPPQAAPHQSAPPQAAPPQAAPAQAAPQAAQAGMPHPGAGARYPYAAGPGGGQADHGAGWPEQTGAASYTSPIPIRRTHLGHALTSEWTKIRSVRSTMWTIGVFLLLVVGIGLLVAAQTNDTDYRDVPYTIPAFFGLILGQICLITLGVLVITSEYGTGMIRTTFTASPQRYRVLAAKIMVYFVVAFVVSVVSIGLVGLAASALHEGSSTRSWQGTVLKGSLYVSLLGVLSLAVGSMLRHSAGAITAMLGLVLVPAILPAFLLLSDSTRTIGNKMMKYNAPNSLAQIFQIDDSSAGTSQMWLLVGVTAAAVAGAFLLLQRRDV